MKVIAFNGSARRDGNTATLIETIFEELQLQGIHCEMIQMASQPIRGCMACGACFKNKDKKCVIISDNVNAWIEKMVEADGIILGSPVYFADVTSELKALIDRAGMVGRANDELFKRKLGAAVVAARRGGSIHAFDSINHFFLISQMIIPGSTYWNMGFGREKGEVEKDQEGLLTMRVLGQNMAWLLQKING